MTSIPQMKKISNELGSDKNSLDYINTPSNTVFIDKLLGDMSNDQE